MKGQTKVLPELNWKQKLNTKGTVVHDDVSIRLTTGPKSKGPEFKRINITIRNKLWSQLGSNYIVFAAMKNRMYFRGVSDPKEGYCLGIKSSEFSAYVSAQLNPEEVSIYSKFEGDYAWKYDEYYELYYIEKEENNEPEE